MYNALFCDGTLCMNRLSETFQLDGFSVTSKQLTFVHGQGQLKKRAKTLKEFVGLITIFF